MRNTDSSTLRPIYWIPTPNRSEWQPLLYFNFPLMYIIEKTIAWIKTIFLPMESSTTITTQIFCHAGSVYEDKKTNGLSHFLEHMFFKGGKKYPTPEVLNKLLDSIGAEFNAYTSDYFASYYVKSSPEYRATGLDVLADMICHATLPAEEIEKEKDVILQELQMYRDQPRQWMLMNAKTRYHWDNAYGRPILGGEETIKAVSHESLMSHKNALYTKDNLIIVVAGRLVDQQGVEELIEKEFADLWEKSNLKRAKYTWYKPTERISQLTQWVNQSHIICFAEGISLDDEKTWKAAKILANALGWTCSARLYSELREKLGLCYYVWASHSASNDFGQFQMYAGLDKEKLQFGLDKMMEICDDIAQHGITEEEFVLAKNNYIGMLQMGLESSDELSDRAGSRYMMRGDITPLEEIIQQYREITYEQVKTLSSLLSSDRMYTYYIG